MRYGVCLGLKKPERIHSAAAAGFDYIECGFRDVAEISEEGMSQLMRQLDAEGIGCEAANGFIPSSMPIYRPYSETGIDRYVRTGFRACRAIGIKTVVFGSGGARNVPDGMSFSDCFRKLIDFIRYTAAPAADAAGVTLAVEPLTRGECNIINTLREGAELAAASGCGNTGVTADIYHMHNCGDGPDEIRLLGAAVKHGHISFPLEREGRNRTFPADAGEYGYREFLAALRDSGVTRCSVEAGTSDFASDCAAAAKMLRSIVL